MNIGGVVLAHWYYGCALIGHMFVCALKIHAAALNKEEIPQLDIREIAESTWQIGSSVANRIEQGIGQSIVTAVTNEQASIAAQNVANEVNAATMKAILEATVPPPKGN